MNKYPKPAARHDMIVSNNLISVIIPACNSEKTIHETVESVLAQSYNNYEITVVDDGSTDNTSKILKVFNNTIHYIYQPNKGVAAARNAGLKASHGDYFAFLDADDIWFQHKIELQLMCMQKFSEVGVVFSDFSLFDNKGIKSQSWIKEYFEVFQCYKLDFESTFQTRYDLDALDTINPRKCPCCRVYKGNMIKDIFQGNFILPSTVLIRKTCLENIGFLNEAYKQNADYDLFLRLVAKYEACYIDVPLIKYRTWENNISKKITNVLSFSEIASIIEDFLTKNPSFATENSKIVSRRRGQLYCQLGTSYLLENNMREAKNNFLASIRFSRFSYWRAYLFLLLSMCNPRVTTFLRSAKKFFLKTAHASNQSN